MLSGCGGISSPDAVGKIGRAEKVRDVEEAYFRYSGSRETAQACRARVAGEKVEYRRRYE